MDYLVSLVLTGAVGVALVLFGLPIVDLIGRFRPTRSQRAPSAVPKSTFVETGPAFSPLRMVDSGQKWPSEVVHRKTAMDLLPWPSETWKDNPFPSSARVRSEAESAEARRIDAEAKKAAAESRRRAEQAQRAEAEARRLLAETAPKAPSQRPGAKRAAARRQAASPQKSQPRVTPAPTPGVTRRPDPTPPAAQGSRDAVSADEILAIANDPSKGLADAVEHVRNRTGWSFQRAAQHVAMALRQRG